MRVPSSSGPEESGANAAQWNCIRITERVKTAYIGLGSNLGDSLHILQEAWQALGMRPGIKLLRLSSPYRTQPVGMVSRHWFINAAGSLKTSLTPLELLQELLAVEREFGRTRDSSVQEYQDRILDFDLLFYEQTILDSRDLVLPHPEIGNRLFVLQPLCEIAPAYVHPRLQRTIHDLLRHLENKVDNPPVVARLSWEECGH